mgnify:CR=1 FL=1
MITLRRVPNTDKNFIALVQALDKDLAIRDGEDHDFYYQFNGLENIHHCVVAYNNEDKAVGCGAFKEYNKQETEIKRMYVLPETRGQGIALIILNQLENWSKSLGYTQCILETGIQQPEAISLYKKAGYSITDNYGQYTGVTNSICFAKKLK